MKAKLKKRIQRTVGRSIYKYEAGTEATIVDDKIENNTAQLKFDKKQVFEVNSKFFDVLPEEKETELSGEVHLGFTKEVFFTGADDESTPSIETIDEETNTTDTE